MPARHRAFSGEVRSDVGCLGPARDVLSPNDFAVASSGQGQHLSEENIVTRIYSLGNGRAVYPEEREREHAVSFLDDPVPCGRCVHKERELEEVPLMDLALLIVGLVVDYAESPWDTELSESGLLSSLPKHAIHRILTIDQRATREFRAESWRLPGPKEEDASVPRDVCDCLPNDAQ